MKGALLYIWVNMGCANCMMSHTSAVNSSVNSYRSTNHCCINCLYI